MNKLASLLVLLIVFASGYSQDIGAIISNLQTDKQKADTLFYFSLNYMMKRKNDSAQYWIRKGLPFALNSKDEERIAKYYCRKVMSPG
jgi:hypothetical protein